jgi:Domain of unknown function (DUF1918)
MHAVVGDVIVIEGTVVDHPRRRGEVVEVLETGGDERYRVRWEDGHESLFFPGPGARVVGRG